MGRAPRLASHLPPFAHTTLCPASHAFYSFLCSAKAVYPNGDQFEGSFNDAKQKHGRGVYTWSTATGSNPWVPEEGYPGE